MKAKLSLGFLGIPRDLRAAPLFCAAPRFLCAPLALLLLTACGKTVVQDRPVTVKVPVAQPCRLEAPAPVQSLAMLYPDATWDAMDVRQKAAAVGKWALQLRTYSEQLYAATAACP